MRHVIAGLIIAMPATAFAAGSDSSEPPTPTQTTTECTNGMVWDEKTETCVAPKDSRLDDDTLYQAAREFAYAEQPEHAITALRAMTEGETDRVLTYLGFAHRSAGDMQAGMAFYQAALTQNPDNLLARSYMGQAFLLQDDAVSALNQLREIKARGGADTWAAASLQKAIETGVGSSY